MNARTLPRLRDQAHRAALAASGVALIGLLVTGSLLASPLPGAGEALPGADVFVTARVAALLAEPRPSSSAVARLPVGTRTLLLGSRGSFLRVQTRDERTDPLSSGETSVGTSVGASVGAPADAAAGSPAGVASSSPCSPPPGLVGWLPASSATPVASGPEGTALLLATGTFLAATAPQRPLGVALLARGVERRRAEGFPDAQAEVALGEAAEALAAAGSTLLAGLAAPVRGFPGAAPRAVYDGAAFRSALALLEASGEGESPLGDRARAGLLRSLLPVPASGLTALWNETAGWLALTERTASPQVLAGAADRLGLSSLALGRLLLAAGQLDDLAALEERVRAAAVRVKDLLPDEPDGPRLAARAGLLAALRGDGTAPFPQRRTWGAGPEPLTVSIEGELGDLALVVRRRGTDVVRRVAVPVLPVPGSLRLSPDGSAAAWLESSAPATIVPALVRLDAPGVDGDATLLAGGRPLRDRRRAHLAARLLSFSADGSRLSVALTAWDQVPPEAPRLAVVDTRSGELVVDASSLPGGKARVRRALRQTAR